MKHDSTTYLRQRLTIKSVPQTTKKFSKFEKNMMWFLRGCWRCPKKCPHEKAPGKKAPKKIASRKYAPQVNSHPEKSSPGKLPPSPDNCLPKNCFSKFLFLLTLSYGCSF